MQKRSKANIKGMDVSHWQGHIHWKKVKEAGISFVYVKATEGETYVDPILVNNVAEAKKEGLLVGAYHFARFHDKEEVMREGQHFLTHIRSLDLDLPPVLDLEVNEGISPSLLSNYVLVFADMVRKENHTPLMLYTSSFFALEELSLDLKDLSLWIAHYGVNKPMENGIWDRWDVFQYDNQGRLPGVNGPVDLNEWDLQAFQMMREGKTKTLNNTHPQLAAQLRIQPGDTFWALEVKNGWTHGTLQALNPTLHPEKLQIGEKINVPRS